jgi:hypothetical protein
VRTLLLVAVLLLSLEASAGAADLLHTLSPRLVWLLDEQSGTQVADSSGNAGTGTAYGYWDWAGAACNNGFKSRSAGGLVYLYPLPSGMRFTSAVTTSAWWRTDTAAPGRAFLTRGKFLDGRYDFALRMSGTPTIPSISATITHSNGTECTVTSTPFNYADDLLHHYLMSYDGAFLRLFIDGVANPSTPLACSGDIGLFGNEFVTTFDTPTGAYVRGTIDAVRVYSGAADAAAAADLYSCDVACSTACPAGLASTPTITPTWTVASAFTPTVPAATPTSTATSTATPTATSGSIGPTNTPTATPTASATGLAPTATPTSAFCRAGQNESVFLITASADDGNVTRYTYNDLTYPPNLPLSDDTFHAGLPERSLINNGTAYRIAVSLMRWNTATQPDGTAWPANTVVAGGFFRGRYTATVNETIDGDRLVFEWYSWSPPMGDANWTNTVPVAADLVYAGAETLSNYAAYQSTALTHVSQVNLSGYTGLRTQISAAVEPPTGLNAAQWYSADFSGAVITEQLVLCWSAAAPATTDTPAVPTGTATSTPTPTKTSTSTPSTTPSVTSTPESTETPTSTSTATPTRTPSETATSTPTSTPTATSTAANTETSTPTNTPTQTPTDTPTSTPTATVTPRPQQRARPRGRPRARRSRLPPPLRPTRRPSPRRLPPARRR